MSISTFYFEPMINSEPKAISKENQEFLEQFYLIIESYNHNGTHGESVVRKNSIIGDPILFNVKEKKIGTAKFNIPTKLTLKSESEKIKDEIERYRKETAVAAER